MSAPAIPDAGTINTIVLIDGNLTRSAQVNAVMTATEAKALALFESGVQTREGGMATGTATTVGWLIGRAVRGAVLECLQTQ